MCHSCMYLLTTPPSNWSLLNCKAYSMQTVKYFLFIIIKLENTRIWKWNDPTDTLIY